MKNKFSALVSLSLFAVAGCAPYRMAPLSPSHPAHSEAVAAPVSPISRSLAYTSADRVVAQQGEYKPQAQKTVIGEGKVVATVPSANQLVVEHGEIKDFMGPMTMGYKIDSPSLLEGLKAGDKVRFTIDVQTKSIVKIEKLNL
jgi:Cu(I)/Ag(I) efflux system protein CusF